MKGTEVTIGKKGIDLTAFVADVLRPHEVMAAEGTLQSAIYNQK